VTYNIFISHAEIDTPIAEAVRDSLIEAFKGNIKPFLASSDIPTASEWKAELRKYLDSSDSIISILTLDSINNPWIYLEWSPFWIRDKTYYVLHTGDISLDALIHPMQDRQATNILNKERVNSLFKVLATNSSTKPIPYEFVDQFIATIKDAQEKKLDSAYNIYRLRLSDLPENDSEKIKVANFFYRKDEIDVFVRVAREIRDDLKKVDLICDILRDSKLSHDKELEVICSVAESINSADRLGNVAILLIEFGNLDSQALREILEDLAKRNKAELRKIATYLIDNDQEETELFIFVCNRVKGNSAEFRKVIEHLLRANKFRTEYFSNLIDMFTNAAEIKNLAIFMIEEVHHQGTDQFEQVVKILSGKNKSHFKTVMEKLKIKNVELYENLDKMFGE
jgi:hypothetical protein